MAKTFVDGEILTAKDLNDLSGDVTALETKLGHKIVIGGTGYDAFGVTSSIPAYTLAGSAPLYYATIEMPFPFEPPAGWGFYYDTAESTGFTVVASSGVGTGITRVRILQGGSNNKLLTKLAWRLAPLP